MYAPVTGEDAGDSRNEITRAIASGEVQPLVSASGIVLRLSGVSMVAGAMQLKRMRWSRYSRASTRLRAATPALATVYAAAPAPPDSIAREATITTLPPPAARRGMAARQTACAVSRFACIIAGHSASGDFASGPDPA